MYSKMYSISMNVRYGIRMNYLGLGLCILYWAVNELCICICLGYICMFVACLCLCIMFM
jgi:hypothetical protein